MRFDPLTSRSWALARSFARSALLRSSGLFAGGGFYTSVAEILMQLQDGGAREQTGRSIISFNYTEYDACAAYQVLCCVAFYHKLCLKKKKLKATEAKCPYGIMFVWAVH